jgi:hypothetical protein
MVPSIFFLIIINNHRHRCLGGGTNEKGEPRKHSLQTFSCNDAGHKPYANAKKKKKVSDASHFLHFLPQAELYATALEDGRGPAEARREVRVIRGRQLQATEVRLEGEGASVLKGRRREVFQPSPEPGGPRLVLRLDERPEGTVYSGAQCLGMMLARLLFKRGSLKTRHPDFLGPWGSRSVQAPSPRGRGSKIKKKPDAGEAFR